MYRELLRLTNAIESNRVFYSIKKGLMALIPVLMIGSFALMVRSFPIPEFQAWLEAALGGWLLKIFSFVSDSTFGFISAFLAFSVSYYYSESLLPGHRDFQVMAVINSFACFVASFGAASGSLQLAHFGAIGAFTAMLCAVLSTWLFYQFCKLIRGRFRFYAMGADFQFRSVFTAILPSAACVFIFVLLNLGIQDLFPVQNINELIAYFIVMPFDQMSSNLGGGILYVVLLNLLWFFGIHGGNMMEQVSQMLFVPADADPTVIVSKTFLDNFALMGGCGTTICLLLALLLFSREKNNRQLARSALPFSFFNINEMLIFGFPVILNPVMLIPFIVVPILSLCIAYFATAIGFLPVISETITWTTPVFFSGFIASGSYRGIVVQLVILLAGTAVYVPFVRLAEKMAGDREQMMADQLTADYKAAEKEGVQAFYLDRNDSLGMIAKKMVSVLRSDLQKGKIPLFYQPQADEKGAIVGAEALLRWHFGGRPVYPPLALSLAGEDGIFDQLTKQILETAAKETKRLNEVLHGPLTVSANITANQLNDAGWIQFTKGLVKRFGIAGRFCLEVTEDTSLQRFDHIEDHLKELNQSGILAAIDDFSMGHTSLVYLQNNQFQFVKLDGSLVKMMEENERSRDIVRSIITLGESLGFQVVAEYVENEWLLKELLALGCRLFQGYLYSRALEADEFIRFCEKNRRNETQSQNQEKALKTNDSPWRY